MEQNMEKSRILILTMLIALLLSACSSNKRLEYALDFAGDNRSELEKVLAHYKDSALKYRAACFLIENMPHYFGYEGWELDSIKSAMVTAVSQGFVNKQHKERWKGFSYTTMDKVYDAHVITADYLIENIDQAFAVWKGKPWARSISFEDFCEFLLPYRIENEPLERWRKAYMDRYLPILDSLYQGEDPVIAADSLGTWLKREHFGYVIDFSTPRLGANFLLNHRAGSCRESCDLTAYLLRALGFPVTTDIFHYSPENQHGHLWNVLKDTTGAIIPFWIMETRVKRGGGDTRQKGKVYRLCYGAQEEKVKGMYSCNEVPSVLRNPYLKDVTAEYFGENETEIAIDDKLCGKYVYLGVFTPNGWTPVDIAEYRDGKAIVKNVEPNVLFIPLASRGEGLMPVGFPFRMEGSTVHYFRPGNNTEKAELWRKYPVRGQLRKHLGGIVGAKIELSNTAGFKHIGWEYSIEQVPELNYNAVYLPAESKYRFARYTSQENKPVEIAELSFYGASGRQIDAKIIRGGEPYNGNQGLNYTKMNDGDYLTFFLSAEMGSSVVLDFGRAEQLDKIVYVPRNDDNFVSAGDMYELFYQHGGRGWVSLGRKQAERECLVYDNAPVGALLWLRNLSRGREEQVFYINEGKQTFMGK